MSAIYRHLSTLSEPTRVRLLALLEAEELGVGELARIVQVPQSTVSRHLKVLREDGWIQRRSVGTASLLRVDPALPGDARKLWQVVRQEADFPEDRRRMRSVLALRGGDSAAFFERMAGKWETIRGDLFGEAFWLPTLLALLPEGLVVADLGCGTGEALAALAPVVRSVIGVDREAAMLSLAATRLDGLRNVSLRQGGLTALPMADAELDIALCMLVLHHVEPLSIAFAEIARALKPGGRLVVLDMVAHDRVDFQRSMGHRHRGFSPAQLTALARDAGMTLHRHRRLPHATEALGPPLQVAIIVRD